MAFSLLLFISCIVLQTSSSLVNVNAQNGGNITIGASIIAFENSLSWTSPSGEFAFGFQQLKTDQDQDQDSFLLSIWYDKIPTKTVVWWAAADAPAAPKGSKLELTADFVLVLTSPEGKEIWKSNPIIGIVNHAFMNDFGNLVIFTSDSSILWESFKNPTDTLLPTQSLESGMFLSSKKSDINYAKGRFRVRLTDGGIQLTTINLPSRHANEPYYQTPDTPSSGFRQVMFNNSGYLYLQFPDNDRFSLTPKLNTSASQYYYRTIIDFDGLLMQYQHPKNSSGSVGWTRVWSVPANICGTVPASVGSGTCGYNSVCSLNEENRPNCKCLNGYFLMDPNDPFGSCKPNFVMSCEEDPHGRSPEELYDFNELTNTDWPTSDYELLTPFTEDQCRESCLNDCMCAVAIFRLGDHCWKKKIPLSNGRFEPRNDGKAFIKIRKGRNHSGSSYPSPDLEKEKEIKHRESIIIIVSILLGGSVLFNVVLVGAVCLCFFFLYNRRYLRIPQDDSMAETNLRHFSFNELQKATNGFKEELGKGAFGVVYKGEISLSGTNKTPTLIAVKKLTSLIQDSEKEFKTEVNVIGQTHHKNLVRLIGFCDDGSQRLLVYEYLRNGTIASFLFGELKPTWSLRSQVAIDVARGLLYLHEECSTHIIHCDIKPQNILLDDYYHAKISDFGMAKLMLLNQSKTHTAIRGTKGYVAPEWFRNLPVTTKVDVYSFGVLLLEIICCRRSVETEVDEAEALLTDWAYDCYRDGVIDELVEFDKEALNDANRVERFVMIAIWCIQEDPSLRPTMKKVTQMLEGVVPPCPCPFTAVN